MTNTPTHLPRGPLMVDVEGLSLSLNEKQFLTHPALGAVVLFDRNYQDKAQVSALIAEIKSLRNPALLVAVDQEGGRVQRFKEEFFTLPPLHNIGKLFDQEPEQAKKSAFDAGRLMAAELRHIDIDFSFAPVLDLADLQSTIIGNRAIHHKPDTISDLAECYIKGMNASGMQATGKHFPGHGGVVSDSHLETPVDNRDLDTLLKADLIPYLNLSQNLGAVMTAHIQFPNIDNDLPTFSRYFLQTILREQIGFNGLIFSDDLVMKGAQTAGNIKDRADAALSAGCDMILICNEPTAAREVAEHIGDRYTPIATRLDHMAGTECITSHDKIAKLGETLTIIS